MSATPHCGIIPGYLLRRLAQAEPELAPVLEFAIRDGDATRGRREVIATRWEGGEPPRPTHQAGEPDDDAGDPAGGRGLLSPELRRAVDDGLRTSRPVATPEQDDLTDPTTDEPESSGFTPLRLVHDAQERTALPGVLVRSEGEPDTGDVAVTEAYDGLGHTFAVLAQAYGRNSLDDEGLALVATVHYGRQYDNAFWDGRQMVFGDGDGVYFNRFTASLDVIAHELAHGLIQYTAGLIYVGQPGALNESVADVWGALVTQWALGQDAEEADWLIGADLFTDRVQGVALRSMAAPGTAYDDPVLGTDPQPAHMDDYVVLPHDGDNDNGGVHINSGIPNKAFHLFATGLGGPAWERPGQVWFDTLTTRGRIPRDVEFAEFAGATLLSAVERYGEGSDVEEALRAAWGGVGVVPAETGGDPGHSASGGDDTAHDDTTSA